MAKKTRRARKASGSAARRTTVVEAPEAAPTRAAMAKPAAQPSRSTGVQQAAVNFREEYAYVLSDLRRVGMLAAAMFAVLIILSFLL